MDDIIVGVLTVLVGAVFCFRGYLAMRLIIPIWGAFIGFMVGAGLVSSFTDDGFLATALGWIVGFAVAIVFGLIAYLYYVVAVVLGLGAVGFVLGTSAMVALGVTWSWVIALVGIAAAVVLAAVALVGDLPMILLTVVTALAGASTIVGGAMLVFGVIDLDDLGSAATTEVLDDDWWWYVTYVVLAIVGIVAQLRDLDDRMASLRSTWDAPAT